MMSGASSKIWSKKTAELDDVSNRATLATTTRLTAGALGSVEQTLRSMTRLTRENRNKERWKQTDHVKAIRRRTLTVHGLAYSKRRAIKSWYNVHEGYKSPK